jgi:hypothetical protein
MFSKYTFGGGISMENILKSETKNIKRNIDIHIYKTAKV